MRIVGQVHLHTPDEIEEAIEQALAMLERVAPPDDLRVTAFGKAVDLLTGKNVQIEQFQPGGLAIPRGGIG